MVDSKPWPQAAVGNHDYRQAAVVIIGAGISGICTAIDLIRRNNCRKIIIVEKSGGVGGTWYDNRFPGCCCDVWSLLYSFSFEQNSDWTREYPGQEEILDYLTGVVQKYGLYRHIRFNTEAKECNWDEDSRQWKVQVEVAGGKEGEFSPSYTITADFLVSAVGQLNYPRYPDIAGIESFQGKLIHSARWDWCYDWTKKRIAVIGNGATAVQIVPEIVKVAKQVTVYQRSPNWIVPRLDEPVSPLWRALYRYLPPVRWRRRAWMMDYRESLHDVVATAESDKGQVVKQLCSEMLTAAFPEDADMRSTLTPNYSPGCKRIIQSDDYYPALKRKNCTLETRHIRSITATGIETEGGGPEEFDLIICATGFRTVEFMHPLKVKGCRGRSLESIWKNGARALYGTTVEDLPNFAMLYGPNINLGHNSIVLMIEAQSRYINALIREVLEAKRQGKPLSIKPKKERVDVYNADAQARLATSSFADARCNSWYKDRNGIITNNWYGTVVEYQKMMSKVVWGDFDVDGGSSERREDVFIGRVVEERQISSATIGMAVGVGVGVGVALGALGVGLATMTKGAGRR